MLFPLSTVSKVLTTLAPRLSPANDKSGWTRFLNLAQAATYLIAIGLCFLPSSAFGAPSFVQERDNRIASGRTVSASFSSAATTGNLIVAYVVWNNTGSVSVSDSAGNVYVSASGPTNWHRSQYSAQIFYAKNINGGAISVAATFSKTISSFGSIYIHEYAGLDTSTPLDIAVAATGSSGTLNSGSIVTSNATDLIFGAAVSDGTVSSPSSGYTIRSTSHGDITMDKTVFANGAYSATAANSGGAWAINIAAFKAATTGTDTTAPTVPAGLTATALSISQINLAWTASTDASSLPNQLTYEIYRDSLKVATTAAGTTSWIDTGLASGTTYTYAVKALDPAGNASALSASTTGTTWAAAVLPSISFFAPSSSSIVAGEQTALSWVTSDATSLTIDNGVGTATGSLSVTVQPAATTVYTLTASNAAGTTTAQTTVTVSLPPEIIPPDIQSPTTPTNLIPITVSPSQINLSWNSSTDNVRVTGYDVYRNGAKIATTATTSFSDTGLSASTTYTYSVSAFDAAGNVSAQSSGASETTFALAKGNYTTTFPLTENPIFENGNWINGKTTGLDWANVRTTGGLVYGTESGSGGYDDSTAILTGTWGPNQTVQATVRSLNQNENIFEEIELRLRSSISAHRNSGYEVNFRCSTGAGRYVQIVRWNGALGDFTYIDATTGPGLRNGDIVKASIVGNVITVYINGVQVLQGTDSTFSSGNPGLGFYLHNGTSSQNSDFGFTSFSASDGSAADTQAPTIPTSLVATTISPSQINLSWTASSDNVAVAGYQVYRNGQSAGVTLIPSYSDTGLTASTTYTYTVAAFDTAGNLSSQSSSTSKATAANDVISPSTPTNLQKQRATSNSVTITWSASTDNLAVAGYRVFRNGTQVGTTTLTSYTDSGLSSSTAYVYTVAAYDTSNNTSALSAQLLATTDAAAAVVVSSTPPSFVQVSHDQISSGTSTAVTFGSATKAGNAIVVYVIWSNTGSATINDTSGNIFVSAGDPVTWDSNYHAQVFYAVNIKGGADTVSATFQNTINSFGVVYIHEYAGINTASPVDVAVSASGSSATLNSGAAVTTSSNDLIFSAGVSDNVVTAGGTGFTVRDMAYGNITQDTIASVPGAYSATATHSGNTWGMQLVAFRPAN